MNPRTTRWLAGLALVLTALVAVLEHRPRPDAAGDEAAPLLFEAFDPRQAQSIEVTLSNQTFRVQRTRADWDFTAPTAFPADATAIQQFLGSLLSLRQQSHVSAEAIKSQTNTLAAFGLDPPVATVTIGFDSDRIALNVGTRTLIGNQVYVQRPGRPGIAVVDGRFAEGLPPHAFAWRSRGLLPRGGPAFDRLTLVASHGFELQWDASNGLWKLTEPVPLRADQGITQTLLQALALARVADFVTDKPPADLNAYGLQTPALTLKIGLGTNDLTQLHLGASPTNQPDRVYARFARYPTIFTLPKDDQGVVGLLQQPHEFYRDRTLISFPGEPRFDVIQVSSARQEPFQLHRASGGDWAITRPFSAPADAELVARFLGLLRNVPIIEFAEDQVPDLARFRLDPPARQYAFLTSTPGTSGPTNVPVVEIRFTDPQTNALDRAFASRSDENSVYVVPSGLVAQLPLAAYELRDRQLWDFAATNVTRITISQSGRSRELAPHPVRGWSEDPVLNAGIDSVLHHLGRLRAVSWRTRDPEQMKFFRLDYEIAIEARVGGVVRTHAIQFGTASPSGHRHAATVLEEGVPVLFEFPGARFADVLQFLSPPPEPASLP